MSFSRTLTGFRRSVSRPSASRNCAVASRNSGTVARNFLRSLLPGAPLKADELASLSLDLRVSISRFRCSCSIRARSASDCLSSAWFWAKAEKGNQRRAGTIIAGMVRRLIKGILPREAPGRNAEGRAHSGCGDGPNERGTLKLDESRISNPKSRNIKLDWQT